ncbi:MAG: hypothetical protein RDV48_30770 [Candidatus Eremiobacteraeota bacterium]|nr:hypothetical protein [Candidatus Eremiobacteraeota bacterium]
MPEQLKKQSVSIFKRELPGGASGFVLLVAFCLLGITILLDIIMGGPPETSFIELLPLSYYFLLALPFFLISYLGAKWWFSTHRTSTLTVFVFTAVLVVFFTLALGPFREQYLQIYSTVLDLILKIPLCEPRMLEGFVTLVAYAIIAGIVAGAQPAIGVNSPSGEKDAKAQEDSADFLAEHGAKE